MDTKIVTTLKGVFGAFFFVNLIRLTVFTHVSVTAVEKYTAIVNVLLALVCIYYAFKLEPLLQKSAGLVKATVWFALIYTLVITFWIKVPIVWFVIYYIVGVYILVKLYQATKSVAFVLAPPTQPMQ